MKKRKTIITDKKTRKRGTAAMAAVMMMTLMTSAGAAETSNKYFDSAFDSGTSYLSDFIKTEKKSVEDDRFKLTLEQYLVAENQAIIIYSFEAKTDDAAEELNSGEFWGMDTINFGPADQGKASCQGFVGERFNTGRKIYGCIVAGDTIKNEEKIDFYLSTDKIKDNPKIIIPMDYNMETKRIQCGDIEVKYNPISITADCTIIDAVGCTGGNCFYFRMKNGEIKTFYQLYYSQSFSNSYDEQENKISEKSYAWARSVIKPDEIVSIIINDTEYPVDNPSASSPVNIDDHLKPFYVNAYVKDGFGMGIPLREFCDGLGAEIAWDNSSRSAIVKYRGSEYVFTVGKISYLKDGIEYSFDYSPYEKAPFIDENGRMIIQPIPDEYMGIYCHGKLFLDENGEYTSDAMWHIIP